MKHVKLFEAWAGLHYLPTLRDTLDGVQRDDIKESFTNAAVWTCEQLGIQLEGRLGRLGLVDQENLVRLLPMERCVEVYHNETGNNKELPIHDLLIAEYPGLFRKPTTQKGEPVPIAVSKEASRLDSFSDTWVMALSYEDPETGVKFVKWFTNRYLCFWMNDRDLPG